MYMVCLLHILGQGGVLEASVAGTTEHRVFWFIEVLSFCAVDGFAIMSGYMANDTPRKYEKLIRMWFQVLFYSFIVTVFLTLIGINDTWSVTHILKSIFPVTSGYYWYFTAFFALFLSVPVLNRFLFTIDTRTAKKAFLIIILLFSVMEIIATPFQTNSGYSAIWLMVLYCIGVLAKRIKLFETWCNLKLIALWALCILVTWGMYAFTGIRRLVNYVSPTILLSGILMVVLFSRIRINGSILKKISPLAFGIYLFQLNQVIWNNVLMDAFTWIAEQPIYIGVMLVILFAFAIFVSGLLVEYIRSKLEKLFRITALSNKIVIGIDAILNKLCRLF